MNEESSDTAIKWWRSPEGRLALGIFLYANIALFVVGILVTFAKRFDEGRIEQAIADGIDFVPVDNDVFLAVSCKGQDLGYKYDLGENKLTFITAVKAEQQSSTARSLSAIFPVTKEEIALAVGLVGGSVGMASHFDRLRIAATEREIHQSLIGFRPYLNAADERQVAKVLVPLAIAGAVVGTAVAGTVFGYFAGVFVAEQLGLDVDCGSKQMHQKLSMPYAWRSLLGTVFTHGYAYLSDCIHKAQFRTVMVDRQVLDYADAPTSEEIGKRLSWVDDTLINRLKEDRDRQCGVGKIGYPILDDNKTLTIHGLASRQPGCWIQSDIEAALKRREIFSRIPLVTDIQLSEHIITREFPSSERERLYPRPTTADALVKIMERLGKGQLLNEKGEATIDIGDIRLLLDAKETCKLLGLASARN